MFDPNSSFVRALLADKKELVTRTKAQLKSQQLLPFLSLFTTFIFNFVQLFQLFAALSLPLLLPFKMPFFCV